MIGNFSYAKLPMVLDLEKSLDTMVASDLISSLAGDQASLESLRSRHPEITLSDPDRQPPQDEFLVLDADASQSYVINAVVGGADLVIDGPPGTGKSQTIANLIATLAARGKKVLFVAEKRAAIDAVVDRLRSVGLEDLVLDLHDGAGSRRKLAENLAKSLASASSIARPDMTAVHENLTQRKRTLIEVTDALHKSREPWGLSIYDAQSRIMAISDSATSTFRIRGEALVRLDKDKFRDTYANLEKFFGLGGFTLSSQSSPWGGAFIDSTISTSDAASQVLELLTTLNTKTLTIAFETFSKTVADCGLLIPTAMRTWGDILQIIRDTKTTLEVFNKDIFELPLAEFARDLTPGKSGGIGGWITKITNRTYRHARKQASRIWIGPKPSPKELSIAIKKAQHVLEAWPQIKKDVTVPETAFKLLDNEDGYQKVVLQLEELAKLTAHTNLLDMSFPTLCDLLISLSEDTTTLFKIPELIRLNAKLQESSLGGLLAEMRSKKLTVDGTLETLEYVWLISIIESVSLSNSLIGAFDGTAHSRTVTEFQRADREHIKSASIRVRRAVSERITQVRDSCPRESEVIERQAHLKRNHLPVRTLFEAAPNVLGALKPCWIMSPLVVAQLLPTQRLFDVVIFDEASQVSPADAVGALMRAEQAVVAGDPRQLPPTSFFATSSGGGEDDESAESEIYETDVTKDMESILDAMSAILPPPIGTRTLGWHYRSKDERLIAFSNAQSELYSFSMTTFPGVSSESCISHVLVPFHSNRLDPLESGADEVRRVVALVAEHAARHPGESLGVITMGIKHANRIEEALRRAGRENPVLEAFISGSASPKARNEMFFVKNLERVQGDERDSIILTIGYGKTADGRMQYRFGPINMQGGHRRLNVAITRARKKITLVCRATLSLITRGY
ncbi:ATP-binding protein [Acidithrix sp. C25]|uniref:DEAD/DEAH box helicase n=1 Tax=Acidithrix sp. C25 TaxID=1671482 RepID=UPI001BCB019C|nr:ATP-binding protein [Acidithrix sp. C25]